MYDYYIQGALDSDSMTMYDYYIQGAIDSDSMTMYDYYNLGANLLVFILQFNTHLNIFSSFWWVNI
jgi:hypothetical protein